MCDACRELKEQINQLDKVLRYVLAEGMTREAYILIGQILENNSYKN